MALLTILCSCLFAQTVNYNTLDGEVYCKLRNDVHIGKHLDERGSIDLKAVSFLSPFIEKYGITEVQKSFYFSDNIDLQHIIRIYFKEKFLVAELIADLQGLEQVEYAEMVPLLRKTYTPNDMGSNSQNSGNWHLYKINAREAWDISKGNASIKVAIVDDAVQTNHPDLMANMLPGRDVADGDNNPNPPDVNYYHGTHVAGIAGAVSDNGIGVASIGYGIRILPVKATRYASGITHGYEGVEWARANGADVINLSWGSTFGGSTGQLVVNNAYNSGVVVVGGAGNDGVSTRFYPAAYNAVIAVGATDINDKKATFSQFGDWITVMAPGVSIRSTVPPTVYELASGTSMASPLVAGLCGLILSVNPDLTPAEVRSCLISTATSINSQNQSYIGLMGGGRIDAHQALQCAALSRIMYDAAAVRFISPSPRICPGTITPQLLIRNNGSQALTQLRINYSVNGGTPGVIDWTGNLARGAESYVSLPAMQVTDGDYTLTASIQNTINGVNNDEIAENNSPGIFSFVVGSTPVRSLPFTETFESDDFSQNGWSIVNPDADLTWEITTASGNTPGNKSARMPFFIYTRVGERDGLVSPAFDFSSFSEVKLRFDHAYRRYQQGFSDSLIIYVTTDCGITYHRIWARGENGTGTFATQTVSTSFFVPAQSADWCFGGDVGTSCYEIDLSTFAGQSGVQIKFEAYNAYGNNLYLDNINITGTANLPVASFNAEGGLSVCANSALTFNDLSSYANSRTWTFEGGIPSVSSAANPQVVYSTPGIYEAKLIVSNAVGTSEQQVMIEVKPAPEVSASGKPLYLCSTSESVTVLAIGSGANNYLWETGSRQFVGNPVNITMDDAGMIVMRGTGINGCTATDTLYLEIEQAPLVGVIQGSHIIQVGETGTYSVNFVPETVYQWGIENGEILSGEGTNQVTARFFGAGTIEVVAVSDINGCISRDELSVNSGVGMEDIAAAWQLYPNPTKGIITVKFTGTTEPVSFRITDITGKLIESGQLINSETIIDLSGYAPGVYILGSGSYFTRIIRN